jgi:hypothetical protein
MTPRLTAKCGLAATALYVAVAVLMLDAPSTDLAASEVHAWIAAHRSAIFIAAYLWGLCCCATWAFLSGLGGALKERGGNPTLASLGVATGYAIYTLSLAGFVFLLGAAYRVDGAAPETTRLLDDLALLAVNLTGFPTAISMAAFLAVMFQRRLFPAWTRWLGVALALAHLLSGGAVAAAGLLSPSGIGVYVAPVLYYAWIAALSIFLLRERRAA